MSSSSPLPNNTMMNGTAQDTASIVQSLLAVQPIVDLSSSCHRRRRRSHSRRRHRSSSRRRRTTTTSSGTTTTPGSDDDESHYSGSGGSSRASSSRDDPLEKSTRLLRRIIRPGLSYTTRCAMAEAAPNQLVLDLCRQHPVLALQRFPTHHNNVALSPLKFLLHNQASAEVLQEFITAFPESVQMYDGDLEDQYHHPMAGEGTNPNQRSVVVNVSHGPESAATTTHPVRTTAAGTYASFQLDGYPLHVACAVRQDAGDIISRLANAFRDAVRCKNPRGYLPLHLLLEYRGAVPALAGVQTLVQLYPEATILQPPAHRGYPPPVFAVLGVPASHCPPAILETILGHLPRHVTSLQFPLGCFTDDLLQAHHAQAITRVVPQLQQLELCPPQWHPEGWDIFAGQFRFPLVVSQLRQLVLKVPKFDPQQQQQPSPPPQPSPVLPSPYDTSDHNNILLSTMLYNLTNLQSLNLVVDYHPSENRNITPALAHLLRHGHLIQLRVDGFPLDLPVLYRALHTNTRLQQLILNELVVPSAVSSASSSSRHPAHHHPYQDQPSSSSTRGATDRPAHATQQHHQQQQQQQPLLRLSDVLQQGNVTLQRATTVSFTGQLGDEYSQIQYWASLNRLGRAVARQTTCVDVLIELLVRAGNDDILWRRPPVNNNNNEDGRQQHRVDPAVAASVDRDVQSIVYGLLRESPGSWSTRAMVHKSFSEYTVGTTTVAGATAEGDVEMQQAEVVTSNTTTTATVRASSPTVAVEALAPPAKRSSVASPVAPPRKRKVHRPFRL